MKDVRKIAFKIRCPVVTGLSFTMGKPTFCATCVSNDCTELLHSPAPDPYYVTSFVSSDKTSITAQVLLTLIFKDNHTWLHSFLKSY